MITLYRFVYLLNWWLFSFFFFFLLHDGAAFSERKREKKAKDINSSQWCKGHVRADITRKNIYATDCNISYYQEATFTQQVYESVYYQSKKKKNPTVALYICSRCSSYRAHAGKKLFSLSCLPIIFILENSRKCRPISHCDAFNDQPLYLTQSWRWCLCPSQSVAHIYFGIEHIGQMFL